MNFSAALLVGGKSTRMGTDKATLLFQSVPLWQRQLDLLRKLEPHEIFISAQTDPPWRPAGIQFAPDNPPSRGPLSGIVATVARVSTNHLLVLAIDMPFMTEAYLRGLCDNVDVDCGVIPFIENRAEPLAAIYPRTAHEDMIEALSGADFSLQSLVNKLMAAGKLTAIHVSRDETQLFRNLNEPHDLI